MKPRHHLSEELLFSYAAGHSNPAFSVVISSHLSFCKSCRERLGCLEDISGYLMEEMTGQQPLEENFQALSDRLDEGSEEEIEPELDIKEHNNTVSYPPVLAQYLKGKDLSWKTVLPGIQQLQVPGFDSKEGKLKLLKIAPGKVIAPHSHSGTELTLVLEGSYSDELGRFQRGDVADLDGSVTHQPIVDGQEDCICLIATEGDLRFKGVLARMIQPLLDF